MQDRWRHLGRYAAWLVLGMAVYVLDVWAVGSGSTAAAAVQAWLARG